MPLMVRNLVTMPAMAAVTKRSRERGRIESLPSGALRVVVYAGIDPVTKRRIFLRETIPAGPKAPRQAEKARTRLLNQVDEKRNPRTRATVGQAVDRWMELSEHASTTRTRYESVIRNHIAPILGDLPLTKLDVDVLDSFYAELRRCRIHCRGKNEIDHRTLREHACDEHTGEPCSPRRPESCRACRRACKPHACNPLAPRTVLKAHWILSGAMDRAVARNWIGTNPTEHAARPSSPNPSPQAPSAEQAAQIVNTAAGRDEDWGAFVWLKMTTGARRGEMCALRRSHIDLSRGEIHVCRAVYADDGGVIQEKATKTDQDRYVPLDDGTLAVVRELLERADDRATAVGLRLPADAFIFSPIPDGSTPPRPTSITQRYRRMVTRLGIDTDLKDLRSYTATELLDAGVDPRTIAGRLGHGGGGATTLRYYGARRAAADQRAANALSGRMPPRPPANSTRTTTHVEDVTEADPIHRRIAAHLRGAIESGVLAPGDHLPTVKALAERYDVVPSTAHRAIANLSDEELVKTARGKRAVVL